ncbi:MAG: hypothetical protein HY775_09895 [Acidobacteria bacterium]|nr:hypothetical protein [Acidobacteriota bacterium]
MADLRSAFGSRRGEGRLQVHLGNLTLTAAAPRATSDEVRAVAMRQREQLDAFMVSRRELDAEQLDLAPRVIRLAVEGAVRMGVTLKETAPGAVVQAVGEELVDRFGEATVSARGIWFVFSRRGREFVLEGPGPAIGFRIPEGAPVAAFSSGTRPEPLAGHADAVGLVADACAILEPAAEAAAGMLRKVSDVPRALDYLRGIAGIRGAVLVGGPAVAVFGGIRIDAA